MTASSADQRAAVDAASRQTETELWLALSTRLQENYARMRQNGVTIDSTSGAGDRRSAAIGGRDGAARPGAASQARSASEILDAFKAGKP